jgi:hypothetical protein
LNRQKKAPRKGLFWKEKEGLLLLFVFLGASLVVGVFFLGAINFLVVHFAASMAASKRWSANQHECGNDGSENVFHGKTLELNMFVKTVENQRITETPGVAYLKLRLFTFLK